jgi:hypothetical protein
MRVQFSREKRVTADWNENQKLPEDERLAFFYKPLEYGEFDASVETIRRLGVLNSDGKITVPEGDAQVELFKLFRTLLPKNVRSAGAPLLAAPGDDKPITIDEIATQSPFVALATELLATLIAVSAPTEVDLKN